jgi:hypothetical protein
MSLDLNLHRQLDAILHEMRPDQEAYQGHPDV